MERIELNGKQEANVTAELLIAAVSVYLAVQEGSSVSCIFRYSVRVREQRKYLGDRRLNIIVICIGLLHDNCEIIPCSFQVRPLVTQMHLSLHKLPYT